MTSPLSVLRRLILREHEHDQEREHAAVDARLDEADQELDEIEVRLRRLEAERRLRERVVEDDRRRGRDAGDDR